MFTGRLLTGIGDIRHRCPVHIAPPTEIIELSTAMHRTAIIPHNQIV